MRCYQYAHTSCILAVLGLVLAANATARGNQTEHSALIDTVFDGLELAIRDVHSGRGTARTRIWEEGPREVLTPGEEPAAGEPKRWERYSADGEAVVDFWFDGERTKSATHEVGGGLTTVHVYEPSESRTLHQKYKGNEGRSKLVIQEGPNHSLFRVLGRDFHPAALSQLDMNVQIRDMRTLLRKAAAAGNLRITYQNDGLLAMEAHGAGFPDLSMVLIPQADYRVSRLRLRYDSQRPDRPSEVSMVYDAKWRRYGSVWYIETLAFQRHETFDAGGGDSDLDTKSGVKISVERFEPTENSGDSVFGIEASIIPLGTEVLDRILGHGYKTSVPLVDEVLLAEALAEPLALIPEARERGGGRDPVPETKTDGARAGISEAPQTDGKASEAPGRMPMVLYAGTAGAVLAALCAVFLLRRWLARKRRGVNDDA